MATHYPFRSWFEFCVMGKAKNNARRKAKDKGKELLPKISYGYAFMGKDKKADGKDEAEDAE